MELKLYKFEGVVFDNIRVMLDLPEDLVEQLLLPHKGIVLDPFAGRGTTGKVAKKLGMDYFLFDICDKNIEIARRYLRRSGVKGYRKHEKRRQQKKDLKLKNFTGD